MAARALDPDASPLPFALGLALVLAFAGQVLLSNVDAPALVGIGLYGAAAVVFIFALRRIESNVPPLGIGKDPGQAHPPRLGLWFTAFAFTALTVQGVL